MKTAGAGEIALRSEVMAYRARKRRAERTTKGGQGGVDHRRPVGRAGTARPAWTIGQMEATLAGRQLGSVESGFSNLGAFETNPG